jgi:p25-alpha
MESAPTGDYKSIFTQFANGKAEMEGKEFAKMAKDSKILDKKLTSTDMDLTFAKIKDKAARKINCE